MDFGSVLYQAQKNEDEPKKDKWYKTSYSPPKKEKSKDAKLSANIQKFLAKKEEEEKEKQLKAEMKKQELLALRNQDKKSVRRVISMLKRTKSANKSVLDDESEGNSGISGSLQPDEDDYGYVSQKAASLYDKLVNKYNDEAEQMQQITEKVERQKQSQKKNVPKEEKPAEDLESIKKGHSEKQPAELSSSKMVVAEKGKNKKAQPPPVDFQSLLKLAEKVQHEPVDIKVKKPKEDDSKQQYYPPFKPRRRHQKTNKPNEHHVGDESRIQNYCNDQSKMRSPQSGNIRATTDAGKCTNSILSSQSPIVKSGSTDSRKFPVPGHKEANLNKICDTTSKTSSLLSGRTSKPDLTLKDSEDTYRAQKLKHSTENKNYSYPKKGPDFENLRRELHQKKGPRSDSKLSPTHITGTLPKSLKPVSDIDTKKNKEHAADLKNSGRNLTSADSRKQTNSNSAPGIHSNPKNYVKSSMTKDVVPKRNPESVRMNDAKRLKTGDKHSRLSVMVHRRKYRNDDIDEDEDSEMDDFIDDTEDGNDYSKYISEIFGYDKSRYNHLSEDEDECMESNFSQLQKEEFISTKHGILEDLADIRREKKEKGRIKHRTEKFGSTSRNPR